MGISRKKTGGVGETVKTIVYAVLIALVVRTIAFEPFNIPSKSMVPTLLVGDYLFVSKYSYGYSRHSLPLSLHLFDGRLMEHIPDRGDVAVFKLPTDNRTDYIKRVIGLPGDHVRIDRGQVYVNDHPLAEDYVESDYRDDVSMREMQVRPDEFFVLGDHRNSSSDSRVWGTVPRRYIYGKAVFSYWPLSKMGRLR